MGSLTPRTRASASVPTEPAKTPVQQRKARKGAPPIPPAPFVAPFESDSVPARQKRTRAAPAPQRYVSASVPVGSEDQKNLGTPPDSVLAAVVGELKRHQRDRRFCIQQQSRSNRAIESLLASIMGFRIDATEANRKKVFAAAKAHRLAVEKGGEGHFGDDTQVFIALPAVSPLILANRDSRATWDALRVSAETEMRRLAKTLPAGVVAFADDVRGFGMLNLAVVVAEAGIPVGDYRTVSGLWKRLGLAVFDGRRQRCVKDKADATRQGYSPRRRSEVYVVGSVSVFMAQRSGMPYREVYERRRAHTAPRIEATADLPADSPMKWTKGRCDNDARRVMTKALVRDLWRVWRGLPPRGASDSENQPTVA